MSAPRPPLPKDPYVVQVADRLLELVGLLMRIYGRRVPPLGLIEAVEKALKDRRRSGALEELLVVVGVEISPATRDDLRKQLRRVERHAAGAVSGLEAAIADCPPLTPEQEQRFARRASLMDAGTSWLKEAEDRVREANLDPGGLNGVSLETLPALRRCAMHATKNLIYIARKLKGQTGEAPDQAEYEDTTPTPDPATVPPAVLSIDELGDARVLTLMPSGGRPVCLRYANGTNRLDCVRRGTEVGHMLIAAALKRTLPDATADSWRRARRAVVTATKGRIDLAGSPACPRFSCRVVLSEALAGLEAP